MSVTDSERPTRDTLVEHQPATDQRERRWWRPEGWRHGLGTARAGWRSRAETVRHSLERPLTSYYLLLGATTTLLAIGLMMVLSSSSVYSFRIFESSYTIFLRQLTWVAIALPAALLASRIPRRWLRVLAWPALVLSVVLLALTQTSLGVEVNGNLNWLAIGPVQIQPSEIAKLAVVLWAADVLARKESLLDNPWQAFVPVVPVIGLVAGLVVWQRDLGTALVIFAILMGVLWVAGVPGRLFGVGVSIIAVAAFYLAASSPVRLRRVTSYIDPFQDFQGAGWQAGHGLLGMSSGGILGKGLSASQQKWGTLPEAHTDFIFAVLGEELGLVGTLLVLALFAALTYAGVRLAINTADPFVRYVAAGVIIWLMAQALINIGMVLALLPVIGIPLPLVSYGGSALVPTVVALGLLVGFARQEPEAAAALSRRSHDGAAPARARSVLARTPGVRGRRGAGSAARRG